MVLPRTTVEHTVLDLAAEGSGDVAVALVASAGQKGLTWDAALVTAMASHPPRSAGARCSGRRWRTSEPAPRAFSRSSTSGTWNEHTGFRRDARNNRPAAVGGITTSETPTGASSLGSTGSSSTRRPTRVVGTVAGTGVAWSPAG